MAENTVLETGNFTLYEPARGVYAAIEKGQSTGSNAGFIDLGNTALVFDTFVNIDASDELKRLCRELTGKEAAWVVNSHSHADHIIGNARFPEATVISSVDARAAIAKTAIDFQAELPTYPDEINKLETALQTANDDAEIKDIHNSLFYLRNFIKPGVKMRLPDMTFTGELAIRGSSRTVRLISFGIAHTPGDVAAYLEGDGIWFMGDTLFQGMHPWLGRGDPELLKEALRIVIKHPAGCYIPGHGQLASSEDILLEIRYIDELLDLVKRKRGDKNDYTPQDISPEFRSWDGPSFLWNIQFLLNKLNGESREKT